MLEELGRAQFWPRQTLGMTWRAEERSVPSGAPWVISNIWNIFKCCFAQVSSRGNAINIHSTLLLSSLTRAHVTLSHFKHTSHPSFGSCGPKSGSHSPDGQSRRPSEIGMLQCVCVCVLPTPHHWYSDHVYLDMWLFSEAANHPGPIIHHSDSNCATWVPKRLSVTW